MGAVRGTTTPIANERLLLAVAEDLKLPLIQVARLAELGTLQNSTSTLADIQIATDTALRLIDNYLFGTRLGMEGQYALQLEPVSISSVLYDTGQELDQLAKMYGVSLELDIAGKFGPVMANRQALQSALVSLGRTLIEAIPSLDGHDLRLQLAAHRCRYGITAGMYSQAEQLTTEALRAGRDLYGNSRQPLSTLTHSGGAGVFVADTILRAMDSRLTTTRHQRMFGLGTVFKLNPQLQLI